MTIGQFMLVGASIIMFCYIALCLVLGEAQGGFFTDLQRSREPTRYWAHVAYAVLIEAVFLWAIFFSDQYSKLE